MPYRWTLTDLIAPYVGSEILTKDPIGWDEAVINMARSEKYKGMNTLYTNSLKFHCNGGGKEYVDAIYESEGIDGRINILIEYDCDGSGTYDTLFDGIVNLASYKTDGEYTTCNIEQSDLHTKLAMRDEISVDLESTTSIGGVTITPANTISLPLSSMSIQYSDLWNSANSDSYTYGYAFTITDVPYANAVALNMVLGNSDIDSATSVSEYNSMLLTADLLPISALVTFNDNTIIYPLSIAYSIDWTGTFADVLSSGTRVTSGADLVLSYGQADAPTQIILYSTASYSTSNFTEDFAVNTSGTININAGDSIWVNWFVNAGSAISGDITFTFTQDSTFQITTDTVAFNSNAKSVLIHEAFNQVVDSICDSDNNFYSDYYGRLDSSKRTYDADGCGSKIALTNGLNIRKFDTKKIYTSLSDVFDAMDCIHNIGMGIVSGLVRVEPLSYWFDSTTKIITLPLVNKYEFKDDNSRYINKIDIGYQKWESEFKGGLDDPNSRHEYSTIIATVKNVYTKICNFITSPYTIEFTRRKNKDVLATEDWRYDNDNFLIAAKKYYRGELSFLVNAGDDSIVITGAELNEITVGDTILIGGTVSNNGYYTVTYALTQNNQGASPVTTLRVAESVTNELLVTGTIEDITSPFYCPEQYIDSFSYGAGMTSLTTAYNLRLTPARMLLAHMNTITAGLQLIRGAIKFVKGEGNTTLECSATVVAYTDGCQEEYKSQQLKENQSFQWNDSSVLNISPIWGTGTYSFEYPLSYSEFKAIKANPYGYIEFYKFANAPMYGYIMSMEYRIKTGLTKFELLKKA